MMLTHDSPKIVEVQIKANQEGKTFIGPGPEPGGADDREVISYSGRALILRWVDPEVAGRYGTQLLVTMRAAGVINSELDLRTDAMSSFAAMPNFGKYVYP